MSECAGCLAKDKCVCLGLPLAAAAVGAADSETVLSRVAHGVCSS